MARRRLPKSLHRTARLEIPLRREELRRYQSAARALGLSVAEWVRRRIERKR